MCTDQRTAGNEDLGFQQRPQGRLGGPEHVPAKHVTESLVDLDAGNLFPRERGQTQTQLERDRFLLFIQMHDPTSVENATAPSREAETTAPPPNPEPPYIGALFGTEPTHPPLPPVISDLVTEVSELASAQPTAVAAIALATLAAVVGPKVKLKRTRSNHALSFNVIIGHEAPRTLPWFDAITAPFVGLALDFQLALCREGSKKINEVIERQREELEQVSKTVAPNDELVARLRTELDRAPAQLKPNVASSSVVPKDLARMLTDSFDGGMTLAALRNDPGADLLRLKSPERAQLAEALSRSWDGMPLVLGHTFCEAHLHEGQSRLHTLLCQEVRRTLSWRARPRLRTGL